MNHIGVLSSTTPSQHLVSFGLDEDWEEDAHDCHTNPKYWRLLWHYFQYRVLLKEIPIQEREQYERKFKRCHRVQRKYGNPTMSLRRKHAKESERRFYERLRERKLRRVAKAIEAGKIA